MVAVVVSAVVALPVSTELSSETVDDGCGFDSVDSSSSSSSSSSPNGFKRTS